MKPPKRPYTAKQGQYLTNTRKSVAIRPQKSDIQMHFGVSGPTTHQMIVRLEALGLIEKIPHTARSIRILLPEDQMPSAAAADPVSKASRTKAPYAVKQGQYWRSFTATRKSMGTRPGSRISGCILASPRLRFT